MPEHEENFSRKNVIARNYFLWNNFMPKEEFYFTSIFCVQSFFDTGFMNF